MENGPVEIVDFPINSMVIFHCYLYVHQRVNVPNHQPVMIVSMLVNWFPIYGKIIQMFHSVGNVIIPTDDSSIIFQRGRSTTNQKEFGEFKSGIWVCVFRVPKMWKRSPSESLPNLQTTPGMSTSLALESAHWSFFGWPLCWKLYNLKQQCNNHHWPPNDAQIPAASGFYMFLSEFPQQPNNIKHWISSLCTLINPNIMSSQSFGSSSSDRSDRKVLGPLSGADWP